MKRGNTSLDNRRVKKYNTIDVTSTEEDSEDSSEKITTLDQRLTVQSTPIDDSVYESSDSDVVVNTTVGATRKQADDANTHTPYMFISTFRREEWEVILQYMSDRRALPFVCKEWRNLGEPVDLQECAIMGDLRTIKWAVEEGAPLQGYMMYYAAYHGRLNVLRWLSSKGCPWGSEYKIHSVSWFVVWGLLLTRGREIYTVLPHANLNVPLIGWKTVDVFRAIPRGDMIALNRFEQTAKWLGRNSWRGFNIG